MKDDHSPASPDRRPVNAQELQNWFLEKNLFGSGATLGDVARHFDRSLDHVKRLSAKYRWQARLREEQAAEAERRHQEVRRRKEIDVVEERLELLADRDLGRAVLRHKFEHFLRHPEELTASETIRLAEWLVRVTQAGAGLSHKLEIQESEHEVRRHIAAQEAAAKNVTRLDRWLKERGTGNAG